MLEDRLRIEDLEKRVDALLAALRMSLFGDDKTAGPVGGLYEQEDMDELLHRAKSRNERRNQRMGWGS